MVYAGLMAEVSESSPKRRPTKEVDHAAAMRKVMASELEEVRHSAANLLPLIAQQKHNEQVMQEVETRLKMEGKFQPPSDRFPQLVREPQLRGKYEAALRGSLVQGVIGNAHVSRLMQKEAEEKQRLRERVQAVGTRGGQLAADAVGGTGEGSIERTGSGDTTGGTGQVALLGLLAAMTPRISEQTPPHAVVLESKSALLLDGPPRAVHDPSNPLLAQDPDLNTVLKQQQKIEQRRELRTQSTIKRLASRATRGTGGTPSAANTATSASVIAGAGAASTTPTATSPTVAKQMPFSKARQSSGVGAGLGIGGGGSSGGGLPASAQPDYLPVKHYSSAVARTSESGLVVLRRGVRPDSHVGKLLREFAGHDDWVANVIIRQRMATIIQAHVRGHLVRMRWRLNPKAVVNNLKKKLAIQRTAEQHRQEMRRTLEMRALTSKQKAVVGPAIQTLISGRLSKKHKALSKHWSKLQKNTDIAAEELAKDEDVESEGSDYSDLDLEDMAAVKFRAKTPPWQKIERSQWVGQYAKLQQLQTRGNLDTLWDLDLSASRMDEVRGRRLQRDPNGGGASSDLDAHSEWDPATHDLPPDLVNEMLLERYTEKYRRLGLGGHGMAAAAAAHEAADDGQGYD